MVKGFNRDMDKYLRGRRESKLSVKFSKKKEKVPEVNENDVTIEDRPSLWQRIFRPRQRMPEDELTEDERAKLEHMEEEIEAVDEAEAAATDPEDIEMLEEARESLIERFFQRMRFFRRRHELEEQAEQLDEAEEALAAQKLALDEDVKEVLKITHKWLGKLTKRYRDEFKKSNDYKRYVEILEKHGVAKKKGK